MNTAMVGFNTTVSTEMFQWPKCLSKKWPKCLSEKIPSDDINWCSPL